MRRYLREGRRETDVDSIVDILETVKANALPTNGAA
jgi:hypothetical protein